MTSVWEGDEKRRSEAICAILKNAAEAQSLSRNGWAYAVSHRMRIYLHEGGGVSWDHTNDAQKVSPLAGGRRITSAGGGFLYEIEELMDWQPCDPLTPLELLARQLEDDQT